MTSPSRTTTDPRERLVVALALIGKTLDPGSVSNRLDIRPTTAWSKGDIDPTRARQVPKPWGKWEYAVESNGLEFEQVESAFARLLGMFEPKKALLREIVAGVSGRAVFTVWWEPEGGIGDFGLPSSYFARIAALTDDVTIYVVPAQRAKARVRKSSKAPRTRRR